MKTSRCNTTQQPSQQRKQLKISTKGVKAFREQQSFLGTAVTFEEPLLKRSTARASKESASTQRSGNMQKNKMLNSNLRMRNYITNDITKRESIGIDESRNHRRNLSNRSYNEERPQSRVTRNSSSKKNKKNSNKSTTKNKRKREKSNTSERATSSMRQQQYDREETAENRQIESFFEKEYKEMQSELLQAKGQIYEQQFKIDRLKQKVAKQESEIHLLKTQQTKEQGKTDEYFSRAERYKAKMREEEDNAVRAEKELKDLLQARNNENNNLRDALDQQYMMTRERVEAAVATLRDMSYHTKYLQQVLLDSNIKSTKFNNIFMEIFNYEDKINEVLRTGHLTISQQQKQDNASYYQSLCEGDGPGVATSSMGNITELQNENSICNFNTNNNQHKKYIQGPLTNKTTDRSEVDSINIEKGEFQLAKYQNTHNYDTNEDGVESTDGGGLKQKMSQMESENRMLRQERDSFHQHISRLEQSNKSQDKIIQSLNQTSHQQSSFQSQNTTVANQSTTTAYGGQGDLKQCGTTTQLMQPFLLSETGRHFSHPQNNNHNKNNNTNVNNDHSYQVHMKQLQAASCNVSCQNQAPFNSNLVQSDPGMMQQFLSNSHYNHHTTTTTENNTVDSSETEQIQFQQPFQQQQNQQQYYEEDQRMMAPPELIFMENMIETNCFSHPISMRGTALTSTKAVNNTNFKKQQQQNAILSPTSTVSMNHIQFPNYKQQQQYQMINNPSNFTLSNNNQQSATTGGNNNNIIQFHQQWQLQQQQQQQLLMQQQQQQINEGKTSGRSHETSTFQQHQDFLESLKEVGEEEENDDNNKSSCQHPYNQMHQQFNSNNNMMGLDNDLNDGVNGNQSNSYNITLSRDNRQSRYQQQQYQKDLSQFYDDNNINEYRLKSSRDQSPIMTQENKENQSITTQEEFNSPLVLKENLSYLSQKIKQNEYCGGFQQQQQNSIINNKDTITTSSQILSERTTNLKKEINNLDEEILMLQGSLQNALAKRNVNTSQ